MTDYDDSVLYVLLRILVNGKNKGVLIHDN
jgi:hypothetical protein